MLPLQIDPEGWNLETAAIDAVNQWRYEPAVLDGRPVAVIVTVLVEFTENHRHTVILYTGLPHRLESCFFPVLTGFLSQYTLDTHGG